MTSSAVTPFADRPTWRGRMHAAAFLAAIPGAVFLILRASHPAAVVAASIYSASVLLGFGTSAGYHRLARSERACRVMQRMDHSTIYLLIAGTYTPVCLLAMPRSWGIPLLSVVGVGAAAGIALKQFGVRRFRIFEIALYPMLGWAAVVASPVLVTHLRPLELVLLAAGGVLYTIGIPVLVRGRPDPWPRKFGYHEVWHSFTIAAGACHFAAVGMMVR